MADEDDDFPLADHPEYTGPKAGDPDMNRARDLKHYDVAGGRRYRPYEPPTSQQTEAEQSRMSQSAERRPSVMASIPESAPVMIAWKAFAAQQPKMMGDHQFELFLAGWSARDSQ